ncbi:FAD synthetase 1,chloroplastic [Trichinella pseudospiralis]
MASRRIQNFSNFCINTASLILQVLPLETGTGRNVHCKLFVYEKKPTDCKITSLKLFVYFENECVRFCLPGCLPYC